MKSRWKSSVSHTDKKKKVSSKAVFALTFYLIAPSIAILMIMTAYPELSKDSLLWVLYRTVPIAVLLVLVSQYGIRYEKGSKPRFILSEIYVVLVLLWLFALLGGEPVIHQTWNEYRFSLHIWNYLVLIFVVTGTNALYYIVEYQAFRERNLACDDSIDGEDSTEDPAVKHKGVVITTAQPH